MKSYQQYCSVARALDAVGDRWVLLIVRELLALGPSRYSDLKRGLPGIATNLLAERLKTMEAEGLIERYEAPPPVGTALFRLTDRGRELQDVLLALSQWGLPRMKTGPNSADTVQPHWNALAGALTLPAHLPADTEIIVGTNTDGETLRIILHQGTFEIRRGTEPAADITLTGSSMLVGAVLSGLLTPDEATSKGLQIDGSHQTLNDLVSTRANTSE
jgi:DNA-binding HxlR family transcriptional regulator